MVELSMLIPSRNEEWLSRTVEDILQHSEANTEVIVVCDGNWPDPPVKDHPRVTMIYHSESIGQRAACNEAARVAKGKYLAKIDAHCSVDQGFDRKLLEAFKETGDDVTMVPTMRNLHVFDWVCPDSHRRYQGPSGPCTVCGKPTTKDVVWIAKKNPQSTAYCVDTTLHFAYCNEWKKKQRGDLVETMSLQGSFFMIHRDKWFDLPICDEKYLNWGQQGCEVAFVTWLTGGRVICCKRTWYSHCFRSQGGDFGFPWACSGRQVERTRQYCRDIWFNNKHPKQVRPLSWLIEKFKPLRDWHDSSGAAVLAKVTEAGAAFTASRVVSVPSGLASVGLPDGTFGKEFLSVPSVVEPLVHSATLGTSPTTSLDVGGEDVAILAMRERSLLGGESLASQNVLPVRTQAEMVGVAASRVTAQMIDDGNMPTDSIGNGTIGNDVKQSVNPVRNATDHNAAVSLPVGASHVVPASSAGIDLDLGENAMDGSVIHSGFGKIAVRHAVSPLQTSCCLGSAGATPPAGPPIVNKIGLVWYSDLACDPTILRACQRQLDRCRNGHPLVSVTLKPVEFGDQNIVMALERGVLSMFRQILAGIEACKTDIIYLCEHDVLYSPGHFKFIPPKRDTFYYDENCYYVFTSDGGSLYYNVMKVSMLCAYRDLLLEHYKTRVARVERDGFSLRLGYEPGNHPFPRGVDLHGRETYWSDGPPCIDIQHGKNFTPNRRKQSQFRNKQNLHAWKESDEVPGWGRTKGRFGEMLAELAAS